MLSRLRHIGKMLLVALLVMSWSSCARWREAKEVVAEAEVKKYRFDAPTIAKLLEKQWWHAPAEEIEKVKHSQFQVPAYINT